MSAEPHPLDPHHDGSPHYVSDDRPSLGDVVTLRVRVPHTADGTPGATEVVLRTVRDGEPAIGRAEQVSQDAAGAWWEVGLRIVNRVTSYRFLVSTGQIGRAHV